jgi:hypothetical protein
MSAAPPPVRVADDPAVLFDVRAAAARRGRRGLKVANPVGKVAKL